MLDWEGDQLTWTNLKPRFQRQFATQSDDKLIINGLYNLANFADAFCDFLHQVLVNVGVLVQFSEI
jgi:hypothetical protein